MFAAAHALVYYSYKKFKALKPKAKMREYEVGLAKYETQIKNINNYLRENHIFYTSNYNTENRIRGLIIVEAYFGLSEHIY